MAVEAAIHKDEMRELGVSQKPTLVCETETEKKEKAGSLNNLSLYHR